MFLVSCIVRLSVDWRYWLEGLAGEDKVGLGEGEYTSEPGYRGLSGILLFGGTIVFKFQGSRNFIGGRDTSESR